MVGGGHRAPTFQRASAVERISPEGRLPIALGMPGFTRPGQVFDAQGRCPCWSMLVQSAPGLPTQVTHQFASGSARWPRPNTSSWVHRRRARSFAPSRQFV